MTDVIEISKVIGALVVIFGAGWSVITVIKRMIKWFKTRILDRIFALEQTTEIIKEDLTSSSEENLILMKGLKATLEAVSQKKCNGNVDDAIQDIDDYTLMRTHELKTKLKKITED